MRLEWISNLFEPRTLSKTKKKKRHPSRVSYIHRSTACRCISSAIYCGISSRTKARVYLAFCEYIIKSQTHTRSRVMISSPKGWLYTNVYLARGELCIQWYTKSATWIKKHCRNFRFCSVFWSGLRVSEIKTTECCFYEWCSTKQGVSRVGDLQRRWLTTMRLEWSRTCSSPEH